MHGIWWGIWLVLGLFLLYSVVPNVLTRVWHWPVMSRLKDEKFVALTFDDGPDPTYTPRLLDVLQESQVRATFFVIAEKAVRHPEIIHRMQAEGHEIQIHGYTHAFVPLLSPLRALKQVRKSAVLMEDRFGLRAAFYRPTWGLLNLWTLVFVLLQQTYRLVTWSIMVGDWRNVEAEELLKRIRLRLHPGAILVLHDSDETFGAVPGAPEQVIQLIPDLAKLVRDHGYQFTTLEGRR